ncbi:MAG: NAD+ synthase [Armatimonadota bacterium]|nr:NAD+ synthase [Armatimonadota bacterium]MDR7451684.1 NAD+ synthase [Armatimonadota bacterium]MDR7465698.1 NAD+ synthase [Armatimonadota bacterium]MDR7493607.1 NAD+ synthase [Armatimonadota bacterium]MDR7499489.1 NAD+ synthase [Armatimonadota bacterium]
MLRIGMAQLNTTVGDLEGNTRRICETIDRARDLGVDVVCFPELSVPGYPPEDLLLKPDFVRANLAALAEVAGATRHITAVVGFVDRDGPLYNAAAVLSDGRQVGVYRKHRLPNYGVFDEKRYFHPGRSAPVFLIRGVPVGITICEDIWLPGGPCQAEAAAGALVILNINGSPYHRHKWQQREEMLRTRAREYGVVLCYNNLVGGQDELVFDGMGMIVDHTGRLLARGRQFEEDLVVCDVDPEAVRRQRRVAPGPPPEEEGGPIATPTVYVSDAPSPSGAPPTPRPPVEPQIPPALDPTEEVYRALVLGTRDYMRKNGFTDAVVGLSGGIDSALVATIAVDALGAEHVHTAWLPSRFSSEDSRRFAAAVAQNLGVERLDLAIDPIYQAFLDSLSATFAGRAADATEENIQARIRGTLLMALSNKFGWLVLATGNKSEMSVGYATLYGDMAGGFAVIKDVPKTLVYELARWRNLRQPIIPEGVITRPPTAELRAGQKDTDTLPPYEILDPILRLYIEEDVPPEEIAAQGYPAEVVARVVTMVDRNEYKRRQAPPGIKITPKALGKDRRLPITNRFRHSLPRPAPVDPS